MEKVGRALHRSGAKTKIRTRRREAGEIVEVVRAVSVSRICAGRGNAEIGARSSNACHIAQVRRLCQLLAIEFVDCVLHVRRGDATGGGVRDLRGRVIASDGGDGANAPENARDGFAVVHLLPYRTVIDCPVANLPVGDAIEIRRAVHVHDVVITLGADARGQRRVIRGRVPSALIIRSAVG